MCKRLNGEGTIRNGYKYFDVGGRKVAEHRLVMEKHLGRKLLSTETIHHINENRLDNNVENLKIVKTGEHLHCHNQKYFVDDKGKQCARCKTYKTFNNYHLDKRIPNGYRIRCKQCDLELNRIYYHKMKLIKPQLWNLDLSRLNKSR